MYRSFLHNRSFMFRVYVLFWYWQLAWEKSWDVKQFMVTITHKLCRNLPFTSVFFDTHTGYWSTGLKNMSFQQEMLNTRKGHIGGKRHALELTWSALLIAVPRLIFWWYIQRFTHILQIHFCCPRETSHFRRFMAPLWIIQKVCLDFLKKRNMSSGL